MNWRLVAEALHKISVQAKGDANSFEDRYPGDPEYTGQIQRKLIVAEIAIMLSAALKQGMKP